MSYFNRKHKDPVHFCRVYKELGCSHVDGYLCNYNECEMRSLYDILKLEDQLEIAYKDRLISIRPELYEFLK